MVTCDDFKHFMINQYDRKDIQQENNDYWNIGCWMEDWTRILPGYWSATITATPTTLVVTAGSD